MTVQHRSRRALSGLLAIAACSAHRAPAPDEVRGDVAFARAESLEAGGAFAQAAAEYEHLGDQVRSTHGRVPARALVRAAAIREERLGDRQAAERDLWRAIRSFPESAGAEDATRALVRLGPEALETRLLATAHDLERTEVADNLLFSAAELAEPDAPGRSRATYERIAELYPKSPLRDDALWRAARIARRSGDTDGALADLGAILERHRNAWLIGSFDSSWMDDAALEVGLIELEDRHDPIRARRAFERLRDDFRDSTLRDDAQLWLARTSEVAGDRQGGCQALAKLRHDFPDSRFLVREAPELAARLGCRVTAP